jgi:eukaryotic-like serine/threonine-protein kinase
MAESKKCSQCGAELQPDAPHGQCLKCLLQLGLNSFHGPPIEQEETFPTEKAGQRIRRYKLLKQIGEGGCGVVYMAEQEEPVRRHVALKIIKPGMDTRSVIARFEAERQALAMMNHPNIAKVLDAGATDNGRPYFVMELVQGTRITDFCDERKFSTRARLELFIQICQAVQHAHQKGVIHRDLKPSNVLVTEQEGAAFPKIIDFGIAKATGERLTDKTIFTAFEKFIGTPTYMSPEQAGLGGLDVDTRSDIYSLGVLLYELLTGRTPFDVQDLRHAAIDEVLKTIREQEPQRPSTRLTTLAESERTVIAQLRQSDPGKLPKLLRGELDWIAMKALEKDRGRRYDTATALARDVQRHLNNEPVVARPPGNLYRFQKLIRRNRLAFAAGSVVVIALLGGLGIASWMLVREREALRLAVAAREQAAAEGAKSRQVSAFLENMLNGVEPSVALGRDTVMLREILDKTAAQLGTELKDQPAVEAELLYNLGDYEKAQTLLSRALTIQRALRGSESTNVISTLNLLGFTFFKPSKLEDAEKNYREALTLEAQVFKSDSPIMASTLDGLAGVLTYQNKLVEAEAMHRRALAIYKKLFGNENRSVAITLFNLSLTVLHQDRVPEAEALCREALAIQRKLYGMSRSFQSRTFL